MTEEGHEESLSFVSLCDGNRGLLINDNPRYFVEMPIGFKKMSMQEKRDAIQKAILDGCDKHGIFYIGGDTIGRCVVEVLQLYFERLRESRHQKQQQETEESGATAAASPPMPQLKREVELTEDLCREVSFQEIGNILSTSIKRDDASKLVTFSGMLLAQTNEDQPNIGYQAESAAGKTHIPLEVSMYFPSSEVLVIASASPTAFLHDSSASTWDPERKVQVCNLENKIIIFMDQPHFQLLEKLRPLLSHDRKELRYMITDKSQKHGLRTKNVVIRGYPTVCFCSTNWDPDEQEKTRLILLSPETDQEKLKESLLLLSLRKSDPAAYKLQMEADTNRTWLMDRIYALRQWGIREIKIPNEGKAVYDRFIEEHPYLQPRHQRDLPRIFSFIKAHALLNCFKREKMEDRADTIIANDTDINEGFELYKKIESANELGLSPYLYAIYADVIEPLLRESYYRQDGNGLLTKDIARKYWQVRHKAMSPKRLRNVLDQLETVGLIRLDVDPEGDKRQKVVFATDLSKTSCSNGNGNHNDNGNG